MHDVLVVGGGISGLLCAQLLRREGLRVAVLDKGRGFGGRLATRRTAGGFADHGAQFITVRDPEFGKWMDDWLARGVAREWFRNPDGRHPRYCGVSGQSGIAAHLAEGLDLRRSTRVVSLVRDDRGDWRAQSAEGGLFAGRGIVLTPPLPQLLPLLATSGYRLPPRDRQRFEAVCYERVIAALVELEGPSAVPEPGGVKVDDGEVLAWIADNRRKGIAAGHTTLTLHSTPDFAMRHWERPDDERIPLMIEAAAPWLGSPVSGWRGHRWGFARPLKTAGSICYADRAARLALAGDSFGSERVEGAALSGIAAAREILSSFAA